jgi:anti-anti-sigma regulatory factor
MVSRSDRSVPVPVIALPVVTVRARGSVDAALLAADLAEAATSGPATVIADLAEVGHFTMEAVAALVEFQLTGHEVVLAASPAVERKLATMGLSGYFARVAGAPS